MKMTIRLTPAVVGTFLYRLLGWGFWAFLVLTCLFFLWAAISHNARVNAAIQSTEDPIEKSKRLTAEADAYFKNLEAERMWRVAQIEKIKREQGIK